MSEIRFYHLERQSLDQVLPVLLTKALQGGRKVIVKVDNSKEVERLNAHLWTYSPDSFLPHGTAKDGFAAQQPVWITDADENFNQADMLVLTGRAESDAMDDFTLCCIMLDGHDPEAVSAARLLWKNYRDQGHDMTYWQQGENGWEKRGE